VPFSEIALILRWVVALWALGWLVLPLSSRLFPFLPDKGLAVGRITALVLLSLGSFWGAALGLVPLRLAPLFFIGIPVLLALGWRQRDFRTRIALHKRAFLFSDLVFLLAFAAFLWVRLRHPETNDLEKPMDMALIAAALRADWLPFENPWFLGQPFTNYYYFGPLLASLIARTLATPPHFAYNLVLPALCAFFLSTTWSLCAALSKSAKIGLVAMLLVCLGGHFEPLRQISKTHQLWPLDWWTTSRVIENTINEYPAFTLLVGDLHGHFYAFCLAVTHFCLCLGILKTESARLRSVLLLLGAAFLTAFVLTNTWDTPLYGLLWMGCALWSRRSERWSSQNTLAFGIGIFLVPLLALPYLFKFKSQISGLVRDIWFPDRFSFLLLWGSWWLLGILALFLEPGEEKPSSEAIFRRFLIGIGVIALLFPYFFYIRGVFGDGDYRHQDTVFKFGLQAWLLLGVGISSELGFRLQSWLAASRSFAKFAFTGSFGLLFFAVVALAPLCVAWTRTTRDAPRDAQGQHILSLDAACYLPPTDQQGIEWLRLNAKPGEGVIEPVGNDYDANFGRVGTFSGVPSVLVWPQHVRGWGAPEDQIQTRTQLLKSLYSDPSALGKLRNLGAVYLFQGLYEPKLPPNPNLERVWSSPTGETQILRLIP
jgi:uncharacterized membrane protein